jgi:vanillate O-demethylase monooxygenase subunit
MLLGQALVLYRIPSTGQYALLHDRCPHRFAPLHRGKLVGDSIACPYHGLEFAASGKCVRNPLADEPPRTAVRSFPVVARHGLVWFWPGDPQQANPSSIPNYAFLDGQEVWRRRSRFAGHHELLADNLLDLGHVDFVHTATFATGGAHARAEQEVTDTGDGGLLVRWTLREVFRSTFLEALFSPAESITQILEMSWQPPSCMTLSIRYGITDANGTMVEERMRMINPHIATPESQSATHYFWTCFPDAASEAFARAVFDGEDQPMIEAVEQYMGGEDFWALRPAVLPGDAGALRARRRLMKLRRRESPSGRLDDLAALDDGDGPLE